MKQTIIFADIHKLIAHERVDRGRFIEVRRLLRKEGVVRRPVIVDRRSHVILDGHHRVRALRELGAKRVPVCYVQYQSAVVRVYLRKKELLMRLLKQAVLEMARSGRLFPSKTTRHLIQNRPMMKPVPVKILRRWRS